MQIRNNWGELIGEINTAYTSAGEVITTNTMYDRGNPVFQRSTSVIIKGKFAPRMSSEGRFFPSRQRPSPQQQHNRRNAIGDVDLCAARYSTRHRNQVQGCEVLKSGEFQ